MKNKLFKICSSVSGALFGGFIVLYVLVWITAPNPLYIPSGKHLSAIYNNNPIVVTNSQSKRNEIYYPNRVSIVLQKSFSQDIPGCYFVFFNQDMPYELNVMFVFSDGDKMIVKNHFHGYGIELGSGTHSSKMLGCGDNDRTSLTEFVGYGILFADISHTVNREHNWWTFMISLWYPIIIFAILPAIFVIKKLRNHTSGSTPKATVEK